MHLRVEITSTGVKRIMSVNDIIENEQRRSRLRKVTDHVHDIGLPGGNSQKLNLKREQWLARWYKRALEKINAK